MNLRSNLKEEYSPLLFLASLGAGGIGISIFMYLMFMIKHPTTPMATFEYIYPILTAGNYTSILVSLNLFAILFFSFIHFKLLVWNFKEFKLFKQTTKYEELKNSNDEVQLMAIPLTLAMSINVLFVIGAAFVPGLWSVVEFMFPFAILGFLAVGAYGLKIYGEYITRVLIHATFDFEKNSNFAQMLAAFAFAMVGVGLAAPGAMSHYVAVSAIGLFFSILFLLISLTIVIIFTVLGFKSMFKYGVKEEAAVSLWMMIPISTLIGIALIRISFGLVHNFEQLPSMPLLFVIGSTVVALQIIVGVFGYKIMKSLGYFDKFLYSDIKSAGLAGLICPGVAFFVFGMFFIFFGLIKNGVVEIFSLGYFIVLAPFVFIQFKTIMTFFKVVNKLIIQK